ncbi:MAG: hypothetical protein KJ732_07430 [Candidatus Margulisbacteria bacterium]|nr:hypothetical protein [Candidatus Margulisiibacteriota bacterium]
MKSIIKLLPPLLLFVILGCASPEKVYRNKSFDFSVTYSSQYKIKEFKFEEIQTGAELTEGKKTISIRAMGAGTMYDGMSFDEYVKIAASVEIQNFDKLVSLESFVSQAGVRGYKTYWEVIEIIPPDEWKEGMVPDRNTVGPIYYFPPKEKKYIGQQPVKVIMIDSYVQSGKEKSILEDLEKIAESFEYL